MSCKIACVFACLGFFALGCSDSTTQGKGSERFTTWGEWLIEDRIPAGDGTTGVIDGWTVYYHKFLVNFHEIVLADSAGNVAAKLAKPRFVDNTNIGSKELITFSELDAKAYTQVSYQIKTAVESEDIVDHADPADLAMMVHDGLSVYVEGEANKRNPENPAQVLVKTFRWGFKTQTSYEHCIAVDQNGTSTEGVVIRSNATDMSELTTKGDHLFYDSLESGENAKPTIRFSEMAAADDGPNGNGDGEVSLQELCSKNIDPDVYDTAGHTAPTIGDFVISLARTIGHFRGEGECTISRIDPYPGGLDADSPPCAEYH